MLCANFKAGNISNCFPEWKNITSDKDILSDVGGMSIECTDIPTQHHIRSSSLSKTESTIAATEIDKLLTKNVIKQVPKHGEGILSDIFLRSKKDGSHRLILNLKEFNKNVAYYHFKMDSLNTILKLMHRDCFMASIDIKDAYYSIAIRQEDQKYLQFQFKGTVYQFTCLPNGLTSGPRKFTKILKPPLSTLHKQGHISSGHLDDFYLQGKAYNQCVQNVIDTAILFTKLGLIVHPTKSVFIPTQKLEILGFVLNSVTMTVKLTAAKALAIQELCTKTLKRKCISIRELASVIGKLVSSFPGVRYGPLYYRYLDQCKTQALKDNKGNFDAITELPKPAREELHWWATNVTQSFNVVSRDEPHLTITTDASHQGWGAHCEGASTGGSWTSSEANYHINYLEMLAAFLGLKTFANMKYNIHIRLRVDNTTAMNIINKMGTSHSDSCNSLVKEMWEWCMGKQIWISAAHIPGSLNFVADFESRHIAKASEWMLNKNKLNDALQTLNFVPEIDLFASRINHQFLKYVSYRPDPKAIDIDAFSITWSSLKCYAFPPFSVIGRMLSKISKDKATGICVLPEWPTQSWYPQALSMLTQEPVYLKASKNLLHLPSHPQEIHPLHQKLTLMVCHLSGNN